MLKYIFSALLVAAVWATVLLLEFPYELVIGVVATVIIVAVLLTIVIVRLVRAQQSARAIEQALQAQAAAHAASARPDLKADIDAMQAEFLRAVQALKGSKLGGKQSGNALYALPWYMIIGPPGSGKSTALRNSGLRFPYMSKSGGAVQGVGGTRNCQWWMTNEAVILDTAGRYTTEDSDRDEWISFLDLLRKNRPRQPINGILVAIAVTDLAYAGPEEVLARAREIRARIDEVMGKLEMVVPVYVLFTKVDLLPGFVEMFGDLGNKDRGQIWGFTVPVTSKTDPATTFAQNFAELAQGIERRTIRRLTEERGMEARDKIYAFPQQFEPLQGNLALFVGELMSESIYTESPIFRGAYFTSGTQEGRPIDRIMNAMAEAFGVQPQMHVVAPYVEAKSYFLGDVFQHVIFPDKKVATRSAARLRRQALTGHGIAVGLLLLALGLTSLPMLSYQRNRALMLETRDAVKELEAHAEVDSVEPIEIEKIDKLRAVERTFAEYESDGVPWLMSMGMYQGEKYGDRAKRLYVKTLRQQVIAPLLTFERDKLVKFSQKYGPLSDEPKQDEQVEYRNRLRLDLLLSGPYAEGEPGLTETERDWLVRQLTAVWNERLDKLKLTGDVETMKSIVGAYVANLAADPSLLFDRNTKLVVSVRKILNRQDRTKALLQELLADVDSLDLNLSELSASTVAIKSDKPTLAGRYTRAAWDDYVCARLAEPFDTLTGDEWVLGLTTDAANEAREELKRAIKTLYVQEYISEWKGFVHRIYVVQPQNYVDAQSLFNDLTRGETPPFARLTNYIYYHTNLPDCTEVEEEEEGLLDAAVKAGTKAGEKKLAKSKAGKAALAGAKLLSKKDQAKLDPNQRTEADIKLAFEKLAAFGYAPPPPPPAEGQPPAPRKEVPLHRYQEELGKVRDLLRDQIAIGGADQLKALSGGVRIARQTTDSLINGSDLGEWNSRVTQWLTPPFESLDRLSQQTVSEDVEKKYCEALYKPLTEDVFKRFPFAKAERRNLNIAEFTKWFKPGTGEIWAFYNAVLATRVVREHGTYALARTGQGERSQYNPKIAAFLNRAEDLSRVLFPTGRDTMQVEFDVLIEPDPAVSVTTFEVGDQVAEQKNGPPQWHRIVWPGDKPEGARITARGLMIDGKLPKEGEWALYRLLDEGIVEGSASQNVFVVRWNLQAQDAGIAKVKIRPLEEDTPFFGTRERGLAFMEVFRHPDLIQPPRQLFVGGRGCAAGGE